MEQISKEKVITENECLAWYEKLLETSKKTGLNAYDTFMQEVKSQEGKKIDPSGEPLSTLEKHHITPRFEGGSDNKENLVCVTVKEHVFAHWLRWKVLGKTRDLTAYLFRVGNTDSALASQKQAVREARERDRREEKGFFNSDFQQEMGLRGGSKGSSAGSLSQFEARQTVGRRYGVITGKSNQSQELRVFLSNYSVWAHLDTRNRKQGSTDELFCIISPKETFVKLAEELNNFVPGSIPITKVATMHKLVRGQRKRIYGWRIVDTLTRSQATDGVLED